MFSSMIPRGLHSLALNLFLIAELLFTSRIYRIGGEAVAQPLVLGTIAAISLIYAALAFLDGKLVPLFLYIGSLSLIAFQMSVFSEITNAPINTNAAFQQVTLTTFIVFFMLSRAGLRDDILNQLSIISTAYAGFYLALSMANFAGVLPSAMLEAITITDVERGTRLFVYSGFVAFAWFYWLNRFRKTTSLQNAALMILSGAAVTSSLSRVFIAIVVLVSVMFVFRVPRRAMRILSLTALFSISLIYVAGFFFADWNPFSFFGEDSSGLARALAYEVIRYLLGSYPITGIGIAPNQDYVAQLTGNYYFAAGDIGALGPWWEFGILGFVLFFVASIMVTKDIENIDPYFRVPMFLCGCMLAAYGCIAPVLFSPGGSIIFAVVLGLAMDRQAVKPRAALTDAPSSTSTPDR